MRRLVFTAHAVDRYIDRHAPALGVGEARAMLEAVADSAVRLDWRTSLGDAVYALPSLSVVVAVKEEGEELVAVTTLPRDLAERDERARGDEVEAFEASQRLRAELDRVERRQRGARR